MALAAPIEAKNNLGFSPCGMLFKAFPSLLDMLAKLFSRAIRLPKKERVWGFSPIPSSSASRHSYA
jgi:hypothetical protein